MKNFFKISAVLFLCVLFSSAANAAAPSLVLDPQQLDGNQNVSFSREVTISADQSGTISGLVLNPASWNGLTLGLDNKNSKIVITGTPKDSAIGTFTLNGQVSGETASPATLTIRISNVAAYTLTSSRASLPFTTEVRGTVSTTIASNTGTVPTDLSPSLSTWNGLEIKVSDSRRGIITVTGTPREPGVQKITVNGRVNGVLAQVPAVFIIEVEGKKKEEDSGSGCSTMGFWGLGGLAPILLHWGKKKRN